MTATTLTRPVSSNQSSTGTTGSKRSVAVVIAGLVAASFLISHISTTHHTATTVVPKLSAADVAQVAGDIAPVTAQLSAADVAQVVSDVAPVTVKLSAANSAQIAN